VASLLIAQARPGDAVSRITTIEEDGRRRLDRSADIIDDDDFRGGEEENLYSL